MAARALVGAPVAWPSRLTRAMKQTLACLPVCPATAQPASATTSLVTPGRRAALSGLARAALGALSALALSASTFLPLPATAHAAVSLSLQAPAPLMESSFEAEVVDLVNQDRLAYGLAPVAFDPALLPAARQRATDQVPQPVLNHYDPLGQLVFVKLLARDGVSYLLAGENLARLA